MYIKIRFKLLIAILITGAGVSAAYLVWAQTFPRPDITFPVAELNNCKSETECKAYCNNPENIDACVNFAEKHGLISAGDASKAREFKDVIQGGGPGGCKNQDQCETYCNNQGHMDECISFAEKHNLMAPDDLAEAKKVNEALKQGAKLPGNCQGKQQCEAYCKNPDHAEECIDFAAKAGFIPPDELDQARKILDLVKSGDAPQTCLEGKDQCKAYCSEESHRDQCANFMVKAGFMKPEDAAMFKKTGGKGPGGCQSKEECGDFCSKQENQQICFEFGKENGLIPEDRLKEIQEGSEKMKESLNSAPPEVKQCLQSTAGSDVLQKIDSGTFFPTKDTGEQLGQQMRKCFEKFLPKNTQGQGPPGQGSQGRFGPGDQEQENRGQEKMPPGNFQPPMMQRGQHSPSPLEMQQQYQKQYQEQYQLHQQYYNPPTQGVLPEIIQEGIIRSESNYNPNTNSPSGGRGIMQPMPQGTPLRPNQPAPQTMPPPAETAPAPSPSSYFQYSPFGAILNFFLGK